MRDLILTGASRGIGRATALALAKRGTHRLILVARDRERLDTLVAELRGQGATAIALVGDLSSMRGATELGRELEALVSPGATLVHNAGLWPSKRQLGPDGLEAAFVTNHLAPLTLQQPLIDRGFVSRVLAVGAGLMVKGRFDAQRTPTGEDFSSIRTYCTTKLCFAIAMRELAKRHPELDVLVLHPGVVRTDLGARSGPVGWLLSLVKRGWEAPEPCGDRLARILSRERWSPPGDARWMVEEQEQPWPDVAQDVATRRAVLETTARLLPPSVQPIARTQSR